VEEETGRVRLPLTWFIPDSIVSKYANNVVIQHTETDFIISFFEVRPPLLLGNSEEVQERIAEMDSVQAECIARIIMHESQARGLLGALERNLELHSRKYGDDEDAEPTE